MNINRITNFIRQDFTKDLGIIFNGRPDNPADHPIRVGLSVMIPMLLGLGAAISQTILQSSEGLVSPIITLVVPTAIGAIEMSRQLYMENKKSKKLDERIHKNIQLLGEELRKNL